MNFIVDPETGIVTVPGTNLAFESSSEIPYFLTRSRHGSTGSRKVERWKYDKDGNPIEVRVYGYTPL